jgi:hypothetical protein
MDTLESIRLGLPSIIRPGESDILLPTNIHDFEFDEDTKVLPPARPLNEHTPMSYMIAKSRLAQTFSKAIELVNRIHPAPNYDDVLRLETEARKIYNSIPEFLKFQPYEDDRSEHAVLIMQRYTLNILFQKLLLTLHRPYFTLRLKSNPKYAPSRRACLEGAMTLLNHQYTIWDTLYNQKDNTFYHIDPLSSADFLPAAMIIMIELWQASTDMKGNSGLFTLGRGDHEHMLRVLERTCHIYSINPDVYDVHKAHGVLSHLISKVKFQFYNPNTARKNESGPSPPDNNDIFSSIPMSTTPEPSLDLKSGSARNEHEHSAAMTLGLLSSGGMTPLAGNSAGLSTDFETSKNISLETKSGLTPYMTSTSPLPDASVPFTFFSQGIGAGLDGGATLGWVSVFREILAPNQFVY